MTFARFALAASLFLAAPAIAQQSDMCADRPGKATPACVADAGTVQIETSLADWSHNDTGGARSDDLLFGDTLVKLGIGSNIELRTSFTAFEHDRERAPDGSITTGEGLGDIGLSARWRAVDGGDKHVSIALQPTLTLPVGADAVSDGTWSAELIVPIDMPLTDALSFNLSPGIAAAADADGAGRHLSYSGVAALSYAVSDAVTLGGELAAERDDDPSGHVTQASADLLLAWQPSSDWQLDLSGYAGLNAATPDFELIGGVTRRF